MVNRTTAFKRIKQNRRVLLKNFVLNQNNAVDALFVLKTIRSQEGIVQAWTIIRTLDHSFPLHCFVLQVIKMVITAKLEIN